ncbi:hypothetical protein HYU45_02965 [Candidatus Daviesbacteria bacterium]|nr:hypothetical protein [Candidatus Daviesbacteria bacterium]
MVGKEGQGSFEGMGMELVTNLDTGKQTLRPRRSRKPAGEQVQVKVPAPTRQWWERTGLIAFNKAAEGWRQDQSVVLAETFGHNVEFPGAQMNKAEAEGSLEKAFGIARRSRITSLDVVRMMRAESLNLEERLGTGVNWLPAFVDSAINLLSGVYGLNTYTKKALKQIAHQRQLPQF